MYDIFFFGVGCSMITAENTTNKWTKKQMKTEAWGFIPGFLWTRTTGVAGNRLILSHRHSVIVYKDLSRKGTTTDILPPTPSATCRWTQTSQSHFSLSVSLISFCTHLHFHLFPILFFLVFSLFRFSWQWLFFLFSSPLPFFLCFECMALGHYVLWYIIHVSTWLGCRDTQRAEKILFLHVAAKISPEDISIWLRKQDCLHPCRWQPQTTEDLNKTQGQIRSLCLK